ncbi:gene transfer agent family protein [Bradyrhizobium sp. S69]|uniref:gene transfer agent family protein n=1 Tax=Bradyrhizobium sp. S69 TaxID=1641856 RepID=UPI00131B8185
MTWAGGTDIFDLSHPWVRNVLAVRGIAGPNGSTPAACVNRFEGGAYSMDDCERVIELGLIGGGKTRREAETLLNDHVRGKPILPLAKIAVDVLGALLMGADHVNASA